MKVALAALRFYGFVTRRVEFRGAQRFSWLLGKVGSRGSTVVEIGGAKMRIYLADGYWTKVILGKQYEPEVERELSRLLPDADGFLDCGANIGYWSLIAAGRFGVPTVAVEPASQSFQRLQENIALNELAIEVVEAAISNSDEMTATLVSHPQRHAGATIIDRRERIGQRGYTVEKVGTVTIDSLVEQHFPTGRLVIKLDVEGAELLALEGAKETLARDPVILYEDHETDRESSVSRRMLDLGFAIYADGRKVGLDELASLKQGRLGANFVAKRH